jgi:hypothetical protein
VTHYYFDDCAYWVPMHSDTGMGQVQYKRPHNILTGERVHSTYLGQRIITVDEGSLSQPVPESEFDAASYLRLNADVAADIGDDAERAYRHYLEYGFYENRAWK